MGEFEDERADERAPVGESEVGRGTESGGFETAAAVEEETGEVEGEVGGAVGGGVGTDGEAAVDGGVGVGVIEVGETEIAEGDIHSVDALGEGERDGFVFAADAAEAGVVFRGVGEPVGTGGDPCDGA